MLSTIFCCYPARHGISNKKLKTIKMSDAAISLRVATNNVSYIYIYHYISDDSYITYVYAYSDSYDLKYIVLSYNYSGVATLSQRVLSSSYGLSTRRHSQ